MTSWVGKPRYEVESSERVSDSHNPMESPLIFFFFFSRSREMFVDV